MDISSVSQYTRDAMYELVENQKDLLALIHLGDIAYDIEDNNGTKGDDYFRSIEKIAANIAYMVLAFLCIMSPLKWTPGNHESAHNFSA